MAIITDLSGQRFGKLTVIKRVENHITSGGQSKVMYLCKCDCGNERVVQAGKLKNGRVTQCVACHIPRFDDYTGQRFGMITVLERVGEYGFGVSWKCKCDCGKTIIRTANWLRKPCSGEKNCGCVRGIQTANGHFFIHKKYNTRLYETHQRILSRCRNQNGQDYSDYGGRGITVCDEWSGNYGFINFYNWSIRNGYKSGLSIDRIDVNGNYEPSNCRWADAITQANNKRNNRFLTYNGRSQTVAQWAREYGMSYSMLYLRICRGWSVEDALLTPNLGRGWYCGH